MKKETILAIAVPLMIIVVAVVGALNIKNAPILNLVLLAGLVGVTTMYAYSTIQIARASKEQAEEMKEQRVMSARPVIIQRATSWSETPFRTSGSDDDFYHFEVYNAGNGPAIEVEISLLNKEKSLIHSERKTFLRTGDSATQFNADELVSLEESTYYIVSEYQNIFSRGSRLTWYQTWLPFKTVKASQEGKIYVVAGELEFKEVVEKDRIDAFGRRSKPK